MRRQGSTIALLAALALSGCPKSEPMRDNPPASAHAPEPVAAQPAPPPAQPTPAPPAQPAQPAQPAPVGPAGPSPRPTPHPDDGRDQLDLHAPRPITVGTVQVQAWIADTEDRRRLGLMHVRELPRDHGMLFVYPRARRLAFWMRNTLIALSIAYIADDGTITQIEDMEPRTEVTHPSTRVVRFALEMPKGWFAARGIAPGVKVEGITSLDGFGE